MKDGLGRNLVNREKAVKLFQKTENKWKREMKALKKHNKIVYSMSKHTRFFRELKNTKKTKKIHSDVENKCEISSISSSIRYSKYSLFSDSE